MRSPVALVLALGLVALAAPAAAQDDGGSDLLDLRPLIMLMVDTSGSMERQITCECADDACSNCLPDCGAANDGLGRPPVEKQSRWMVTLEALTGEFENYQCTPMDRTVSNDATYDLGYYRQYGQPWACTMPDNPGGQSCKASGGNAKISQVDNGILDTFGDRARFGLMTFDGWDTYLGTGPLVRAVDYNRDRGADLDGLWSYGTFYGPGLSQTYARPHVDQESDGGLARPVGRFRYPGCDTEYQMDTGARGRDADEGALLSLDSCATPPCDMQSLAGRIQDVLLDTRPWGGTPIAAMLEDLYFHLDQDVNDPFRECRRHYGVLITDGKPDDDYRKFDCDCYQDTDPGLAGYCGGTATPDEFFCPYMRPADVAKKLVAKANPDDKCGLLCELHVLGLALDQEAQTALEEIAMEGGTELADISDASALKQRLDGIVTRSFPVVSRTTPLFVDARDPGAVDPTDATVKQYEISTGFKKGDQDGIPWAGTLERKRAKCEGGVLTPKDVVEDKDRFDRVLSLQSGNRTMWTTVPKGSSDIADYKGIINASNSGFCGTSRNNCENKVLIAQTSLFSTASQVDDFDLQTLASPSPAEVIDWMTGAVGSVRQDVPLGDIFHSEPVVVGAPRIDIADQAFNLFRQSPGVVDRPLTLYVNSNDGVLHAFAVEAVRGAGGSVIYKPGEEIWGFVPPLLVPRLKDQYDKHQFLLDGSPVVKDVYLRRDRALGQNIFNTTYRTVLITGMRGAGNAYIALDVTDPRNPSFLWQFTDQHMGLTYGKPAIVQATFQFDDGGGPKMQSRAVAVLPGGKGTKAEFDLLGNLINPAPNCAALLGVLGGTTAESYQDGNSGAYKTYTAPTEQTTIRHRDEVPCWEAQGRALYFVDVATGRLIKKLYDDNTDDTEIGFRAPLIGTPVAYSNEVGSEASRVFITDADGVIWRVDMSDPLQEQKMESDGQGNFVNEGTKWDSGWTARPFHDIFHDRGPTEGEVSLPPPLLTQDKDGQLVLIAATGDLDNYAKLTARNRVVSLTEVRKPMAPGNGADDWRAALNWQLDTQAEEPGLAQSEIITGPMTLHEGIVYLSSFIATPGGDPCDPGASRMWALDYNTRDKQNTVTTPLTYGPKLVDVYLDQLIPDDQKVVNIPQADAHQKVLLQTPALNDGVACIDISVNQTNIDVGYGNYMTGVAMPLVTGTPPSATYLTANASGPETGSIVKRTEKSEFGKVSTKIDRSKQRRRTRVLGYAAGSD